MQALTSRNGLTKIVARPERSDIESTNTSRGSRQLRGWLLNPKAAVPCHDQPRSVRSHEQNHQRTDLTQYAIIGVPGHVSQWSQPGVALIWTQSKFLGCQLAKQWGEMKACQVYASRDSDTAIFADDGCPVTLMRQWSWQLSTCLKIYTHCVSWLRARDGNREP